MIVCSVLILIWYSVNSFQTPVLPSFHFSPSGYINEHVFQTERQQRSKRKKVIEIKDDEVEVKSREVKKRKPPVKTPAKPPAKAPTEPPAKAPSKPPGKAASTAPAKQRPAAQLSVSFSPDTKSSVETPATANGTSTGMRERE